MKKRRNPAKAALRRAWNALSKKMRAQTPFCEKCGRSAEEARLNVHHILPKKLYPGLMLDEANLIVLCPRCHQFGPGSAHRDPFAWCEWFRNAFPARYAEVVRLLEQGGG